MKILSSLAVFPTKDIKRTAAFYEEKLGFRRMDYLEVEEPHICLYRDAIEIILTESTKEDVVPNRERYGYGEDLYIITTEQEALQEEFAKAGVTFAKSLKMTDYGNKEFIIEDIDGRWLAFGHKQWNDCKERMQWEELYSRAKHVQNDRKISDFMEAGCVSAAILTASGNIYVGVCIDTNSSLGMCAERNAMANMITNGESKIKKVLAILPDGKTGPPCGACREFMMQLGPDSKEIEIMMDYESMDIVTLGELCPKWWTEWRNK